MGKSYCGVVGDSSPATWVYHIVEVVSGQDSKRRNLKRPKMGDLDPAFHEVLKRVQERWPHVIGRLQRKSMKKDQIIHNYTGYRYMQKQK
jgi:hypothetical protein